MKILTISVHPDDETLGCGGTLLKHAQAGDDLYWIIVTKPTLDHWSSEVILEKDQEVKNVARAFGMKETIRLSFKSVQLDYGVMADLMAQIYDALLEIKPEIVYTIHGGDVHSDHQIVHAAVMAVLKPFQMGKLGVNRILSFETISSTDASAPGLRQAFNPTVFSDITDFIDSKIAILELYQSEIHQYPYPRSSDSVRALSRYRGSIIAVPYAEAFMVCREII